MMLIGCAQKASDVNVQATWGKNVSALGITAIYPPREDLFVGDVQLVVQNPCDTGAVYNQPQSIPLGSIPEAEVEAAMENYYDQRPQLPTTSKPVDTSSNAVLPKKPTSAAPSTISISTSGPVTISTGATGQAGLGIATSPAAVSTSASTVQAQPQADAKDPIFPVGTKLTPITRLRLVAFPGFSYSDFNSAGLGVTIPIRALNLTGGADARSGEQGNVSVSQVEEAMLPLPVMLHLVNKFIYGPDVSGVIDATVIHELKGLYEQQMKTDLGCSAPGQYSIKPALIVFISRVFYARSFDYEFSQSQAVAASLRIAAAAAAAAAAQTSSSTGSSTPASTANTAQAAADATSAALRTLTSNSGPGVSTSVETGSQGGLALKQTFDRPLAFGIGQPIVFDADTLLASMAKYEKH